MEFKITKGCGMITQRAGGKLKPLSVKQKSFELEWKV